MKCPECREVKEWNTPNRPYCDDCDTKQRTCTKCGQIVDDFAVYIKVEGGKEVARGHKECVYSANK